MKENSLTLTPRSGSLRARRRIPNSIIFPKELRDAIPSHSPRALQFDRVSATFNAPLFLASLANPEWLSSAGFEATPRVRLSMLAHETGQLNGQFEIGLDLDAETLRALGEFFMKLADQAESKN
jgi:hypothetical protein